MLGEAQLQAVAELFSVLSEPTKLKILQMLQDGPATVGEIMAATGVKAGTGLQRDARPRPGHSVERRPRLPKNVRGTGRGGSARRSSGSRIRGAKAGEEPP